MFIFGHHLNFMSLLEKFLMASNVFESSKFCYFISKFFCFLFTKICKNKNGFYTSETKIYHVIIYLAFMAFGINGTLEILTRPRIMENKMRSLILELGINLKCRIQIIQPLFAASIIFWNRHDFFKILKKINNVDEKVWNFNFLNFYLIC